MVMSHAQVLPADIVCVHDYWPYAKTRLSPGAWAYFNGGAQSGAGCRRNEQAFERYQIWPRVLKNMRSAHTRIELLGRSYDYPIFLAPIAWQAWAHPEGERATALAAEAMSSPFMVSMQSTTDIADLVAIAPAGRFWLQWYWQSDEQATQQLLDRCQGLGVEAIVLTVDAPVQGIRHEELRVGRKRPAHLGTPHLQGFASVDEAQARPGQSPLFATDLLQHAPDWTQVQEFIAQCPLPVWLKGILHPDDARLAVEVGAAGVIVSNHGGRQLAALPAALDCLAAVAAAVGQRVPVIFDGGIRTGSDVFIALALGAQAVCIGRPYLMGLAVGGAAGVAHVLHMLRTEFEVTMALAGCARCSEISAGLLLRSDTP